MSMTKATCSNSTYLAASGSSLVSHVDRLSSDDLETMVTSLTGLTMSSSPFRLQISIIGGFADNKNVSASLLLPILGEFKY